MCIVVEVFVAEELPHLVATEAEVALDFVHVGVGQHEHEGGHQGQHEQCRLPAEHRHGAERGDDDGQRAVQVVYVVGVALQFGVQVVGEPQLRDALADDEQCHADGADGEDCPRYQHPVGDGGVLSKLPGADPDEQPRGDGDGDGAPQAQFRAALYSFDMLVHSLRYFAVYDSLHLTRSSGVPAKTSLPPPLPPSGPRSMTQSARLMMSG